MKTIRKWLPLPLLLLLLLSDYVALQEIRHAMSWIVGENATPASISMLFLANAVTMAFFFEGLSARAVRLLHGIAFMLYTVVMLAIYASGVEYGLQAFPAEVAREGFGLSQVAAVRICAFVIGFTLAIASYSFWSVMGSLINKNANAEGTVAWQAKAERHGLPTDNILGIRPQDRSTGT